MTKNKTTKGSIRLTLGGREVFSLRGAVTISAGFIALVAAGAFEISRLLG